MSDPIEFTPKEKFVISLYKDPAGLFKRNLLRQATYIIASLALVVVRFVNGDENFELFGYGILLFYILYRFVLLKRGVMTMASIIRKYEAQLESKQSVG